MNTYGLLKVGLNVSDERAKTISQNIANINTPKYKSKYVSFEDTLKNVENGKSEISIKESNSTTMRTDGNNVDLESEKVNQASNSLQYNALVTIMNAKISLAKSLIRGQ